MQQKSCDCFMMFRSHMLHLILLILQDASLPHSERRLTEGSRVEGRECVPLDGVQVLSVGVCFFLSHTFRNLISYLFKCQ